MTDYENSPIQEKVKKLLYGVGLVVATLGGERAVLYVRNWHADNKEREREELAETVIKKYREASAEQGLRTRKLRTGVK